jgi:Fe-S cluster assembly protein SufD
MDVKEENMIEAVRQEKDIYLSNFTEFERMTAGQDPEWLHQMRKAAILRVAEFGFPTTRDEEWKYTNVGLLSRTPFDLPAEPGQVSSELLSHPLLNLDGARLVFVDGIFSRQLSRLDDLKAGIRMESLSEAILTTPDEVRARLGRYAEVDEHAFNALNAAFLRDGAYISIPKGAVVESPIYVVYIASGTAGPIVSHPRNLFIAGSSSQVQLVEIYLGEAEASYFTNPVTELIVEDGAVVEHYRVQAESSKSFHIGSLRTYQERASALALHNYDLGGSLVRNNLTVTLDGEGCNAQLDGLYLVHGSRHVDNHTRIEHVKAHCDSRELYKGILTESGRAVFHGRIVVSQGAQKTDSKQTNNNLLLSNNSLVNTKPQLEIYADDVKCTHGATIGRIDEEAIFYLRSRGIPKQAAVNLLIYGFASDVIERVKIEALRSELDRFLFAWLPSSQLQEGPVQS